MKRILMNDPVTLGDRLAPVEVKKPRQELVSFALKALFIAVNAVFLTLFAVLGLLFFLSPSGSDPDWDTLALIAFLSGLVWVLANVGLSALRRPDKPKLHPLLANDRQNFMHELRLDKKTVIFDGSNIYHFGRENGVDAQPLGMLAHALREDGYRVVCFFDANIFFTLTEDGGLAPSEQHSVSKLADIFGLAKDEIYVVPSGVQADQYVLESLKYLPISFAVTNDRFRDYATDYPTVMKTKHWRKGVVFADNEIRLLQHRFQHALRIE